MRIFKILKKFIILGFSLSSNSAEKNAHNFRVTLEELGSIFIKFGQLLALRPDVVSQSITEEMYKLLDEVPPFHKEAVVEILYEQFSKDPEDIFDSFDYIPVASASLAQVHKAHLNGHQVAVKIQRPNITKIVNGDLKILKLLSMVVDILYRKKNKLSELVKEFTNWTILELDYETEVMNMIEYNELSNINKIMSPKVYREKTTPKVITMDFIDGYNLSKIIKAYREEDSNILKEIKSYGFDRVKIVRSIIKNMLETAHLEGYFHADPHPANIMFTKKGELKFIDFGIIGRLSKKERTLVLRYERSLLMGDSKTALDSLLSLSTLPSNFNLKKVKEEHDKMVSQLEKTFDAPDYLEQQKQTAPLILETLRLIQKHGIKIPVNVLRYFKTFETVEGIIFALYPELKIQDMVNEFKRVSLINLTRNLLVEYDDMGLDSFLVKVMNHLESEIIND